MHSSAQATKLNYYNQHTCGQCGRL